MTTSGAGALKAAAAIAVFAMVVMSSQGHPKTEPLCSDCASLCSTNCSAVVAATCSSPCDTSPPPGCQVCESQFSQGCQNCCNNGTISSSASCCANGCVGDCGTCSCDCNSTAQGICMLACKPAYPPTACQDCTTSVGVKCYTSCLSACNDDCVKKEKEC